LPENNSCNKNTIQFYWSSNKLIELSKKNCICHFVVIVQTCLPIFWYLLHSFTIIIEDVGSIKKQNCIKIFYCWQKKAIKYHAILKITFYLMSIILNKILDKILCLLVHNNMPDPLSVIFFVFFIIKFPMIDAWSTVDFPLTVM